VKSQQSHNEMIDANKNENDANMRAKLLQKEVTTLKSQLSVVKKELQEKIPHCKIPSCMKECTFRLRSLDFDPLTYIRLNATEKQQWAQSACDACGQRIQNKGKMQEEQRKDADSARTPRTPRARESISPQKTPRARAMCKTPATLHTPSVSKTPIRGKWKS